ncbi:MAG: DnaJ C-terminal domain-containing protein [Candidatus Giovannonibacteria bacterium]|nr:DnaJ C-terminal domain-containing protein [Candidatus Giovannonibacteria bacterium]
MSKDYYEILGVGKSASQEEVKRAYRKLAHQHHPDKKGGDEKKFKEINEAYQILGDDEKRRRYDQFGSAAFGQGGGAQPGWDFSGFQDFDGNFGGVDLGDIFGDIFGGFGGFSRSRRAKRGSDISLSLDVSFRESVFGGARSVLLDKTSLCDICRGSGAEPGSHVKKCDTCQGTGTVRESRRSILGSFTSLAECSKCRGKGEIPEHFCKHCRGQSVLKKQENINIQIPAGIRDGEAIKLTGMGEALSGGAAGDLYVKINVIPHPIFRREGFDLVMDLYAQPSKMILGGEEAIETLEGPPDGRAGKILVRIPELSKAGDILRLRQKGVPKSRGNRGDLLIVLHQKLPKKLSHEARRLLSDLEKEGL